MTVAWYAARAGGIVAFALLTIAVVVGLTLSGRARMKQWRSRTCTASSVS